MFWYCSFGLVFVLSCLQLNFIYPSLSCLRKKWLVLHFKWINDKCRKKICSPPNIFKMLWKNFIFQFFWQKPQFKICILYKVQSCSDSHFCPYLQDRLLRILCVVCETKWSWFLVSQYFGHLEISNFLGSKFWTFSESQENSGFRTILTFNLWWKFAVVMLLRERE